MNFQSLSKGLEQANSVSLSKLCQKDSSFTLAISEMIHCTLSLSLCCLPFPIPSPFPTHSPF